jgi:hypothetical protein
VIVIPVTILRRQAQVAVFGLGGSGLATARAAGGRGGGRAWDDNRQSRRQGHAEGIITVADLRTADGGFAAFVLSPGVPLTHPEPHWTVVGEGSRRRDHRRHRTVLPRAQADRARCAGRLPSPAPTASRRRRR